MRRRLAALAATLTLATGAGLLFAGPATGTAVPHASSEPRPHCQHVILTQNSGNGPAYHVLICDALLPSGEGWRLIVDGGPLQNGAVIFGYRNP